MSAAPPPAVVITGANGFVGSHLVRYFSGRGWHVVALCRTAPGTSRVPNVAYRSYSLGDRLNEQDLEGADYLIHCACAKYSPRTPDADDVNIRGTRDLLEASRRAGIKQFVYLSSLSAHPEAQSHYGRHKFALEGIFDAQRDLVLRPGLILGHGGLALSITRLLQRLPLVPLIGGGRQPLHPLGIDELCSAIDTLLERNISGTYVVAARAPVTMHAFYTAIARQLGVRRTFVPVPYYPVYLAMRAVEALGITLPITTENLLGLRQIRGFDAALDVRTLGIHIRPFEETLRAMQLT
jgi:nucleoside-diphosphate-sugar epimerase